MNIIERGFLPLRHFQDRIFHKFRDLNDTRNEEEVVGKVVVITGSNSGIGKVLALQMAKRGAVVVMACRNLAKAADAMKEIKEQVPDANLNLVKLDLADMDSVAACAKEIKHKFPSIKILVNNAGYMGCASPIERVKGGFEMNLVTNYLGHFLLTLHLLDNLKTGAPSRIVNVGSIAHELAKLQPEDLNMEKKVFMGHLDFGAYMNAKRCIMLFTKELGKRLSETGVRTYSLCPGIVDTGLFDEFPGFTKFLTRCSMIFIGCNAEQGAETLVYCALSRECAGDTGKAYHFGKSWKKANQILNADPSVSQRVWRSTEQLLGIDSKDFGL